tara:strand:+ start:137 stop:634 length:498 start_codon:yes stop_codon:yes gene_type:complete
MADTIKDISGTRITRVYSAKFYFFKYITETNIEYFDIFPLILSLGKIGKVITGLNFHYLPPKMRIPLLNQMMKLKPDMIQSPVAFAKHFKKLVWAQRKWRPAQTCFKRYVLEDIRGGKILRIERPDWEKVMMQEKVEKFVSGQNQRVNIKKVWRDSIRKIRGMKI